MEVFCSNVVVRNKNVLLSKKETTDRFFLQQKRLGFFDRFEDVEQPEGKFPFALYQLSLFFASHMPTRVGWKCILLQSLNIYVDTQWSGQTEVVVGCNAVAVSQADIWDSAQRKSLMDMPPSTSTTNKRSQYTLPDLIKVQETAWNLQKKASRWRAQKLKKSVQRWVGWDQPELHSHASTTGKD